MNRFNSIESNWNLDPIERYDNICEIELMLFIELNIWDGLINRFESIKDLEQWTQSYWHL